MKDANFQRIIEEHLPPMDGKKELFKANALNSDIRTNLESKIPLAIEDVKTFAPLVKGNTDFETAYNIWKLLRGWFKYKKDPKGQQIVKLPRASMRLQENDCKSYSVLALALAAANGFRIAPKYTAYKSGAKIPTHVYGVAEGKDGKQYIIDGCYPFFNREKKYSFTLPLKFMDVYTLSDNTEEPSNEAAVMVYNPGNKRLTARQKAMFKEAFHNRFKDSLHAGLVQAGKISGTDEDYIGKLSAARKKKIKEGFKKFGRGVATVALGMGRGAFLAFVALNVNGLATKLNKMIQHGIFKPVLEKWKNIGGIEKIFKKAIAKGAKKKALFLSKKARAKFEKKMKAQGLNDEAIAGLCEDVYDNGIGLLPAAIPAIAAAAVPVLATILPLIAKAFAGSKNKELQQEGKEVEEQGGEMVSMIKSGELPPADEATEIPEEEMPESIQAGSPEEISADNSELWGELGKLAGAGIEKLAGKIQAKAKKKPKLQKFVDVMGKAKTAIDDYGTGVYLRKSGAKDLYLDWKKKADNVSSAAGKYLPWIAGGVGGLGVGALLLSRKSK